MKASEVNEWWSESLTRPVKDGEEIRCAECGTWSPVADWVEGEVYCENCGSHSALICPACTKAYDHVWQDDGCLKVRK